MLASLTAAVVLVELLFAPGAVASGGRGVMPVGLFGLPSIHSIIQAIANGFFGALAGALVPDWLKHGTVATVQHLVALPDPAGWAHVARLQGDMTYLAAMLLPLTLTVGAVRYWMVGLTGAAHPSTAVLRCVVVSGVLVAYRWGVEQTVAVANIASHGILGLPAVAGGLRRIIGVLFGGALLSGTGGVFGALLVIVGVVFAAGLFAVQVLLTVLLAVLVVAGPPLIALAAVPELSHLARAWADAVLAVVLVPVGWTVLFATGGALCLDATSFTGAGGGLPAHVAAAFAGLITFALAARLPFMIIARASGAFTSHAMRAPSVAAPGPAAAGAGRVRAANARLRSAGVEGVVSLGRSAGFAAGALGAPAGGAVGAARRRMSGAVGSRTPGPAGVSPRREPGVASPSMRAQGARGRAAAAAGILRDAPRGAVSAARDATARTATTPASSAGRPRPSPGGTRPAASTRGSAPATQAARPGAPGRPLRPSGPGTVRIVPAAGPSAPSTGTGRSRANSTTGASRPPQPEPNGPGTPPPARSAERPAAEGSGAPARRRASGAPPAVAKPGARNPPRTPKSTPRPPSSRPRGSSKRGGSA